MNTSDFRLDEEFGYNSMNEMVDSWEKIVLEEQQNTKAPSES